MSEPGPPSASPETAHSTRRLLGALELRPPRLDLVSLAIASLEYPELEVQASTELLDAYADRVGHLVTDSEVPQLLALQRVLGHEEGFRGDIEDYHASQNSFLNVVLQRKLGLPLTLSIIYLEVARRCGIPLFGVSFPGHFVVAAHVQGRKVVMDPFNRGEFLSRESCEALLGRTAPSLRFSSKMITPSAPKSIAFRMLTNLKRTYLKIGDTERALKVVEHLLALAPDHPAELRARATLLSALGAYRAALADVERCLQLSPKSPDHSHLLIAARELRERVKYPNRSCE